MSYVVGIACFLLFNVFLSIATDHMVHSYGKKALEEKAAYVERQCGILSNQLVLNGMSSYNMTNPSDDKGSNLYELEQLANDIGGRILIIDDHFEILADTYHKNYGQYYVTDELIAAFEGEDVDYSFVGDNIQVISGVYNQDTGDMEAAVLAIASLSDVDDMINYLYTQRATLMGLFLLITLIVIILLVMFMRRSFRNMQDELDIIAEGHQEENMSETGFQEFHRMAVSFNRIINRYKELENSRQEFVSNVSHELKTPITSMKILADSLLTQENVPAEIYADFMNDIVHEIDRENQIINDLLTLVKMDKTRADLNIAPTNINELLEVLLKRISPIAEKRNITIRLETMAGGGGG